MAVAVRLSRIGKKHVPFFRVVAVDSRKKRDGAFLEDLGTYDALKGTFVVFHQERFNAWVAQGAQVSVTVKKLQKKYKKDAAAPAGGLKKSKAKVAPVKEPVVETEVALVQE
ncbi:30S ribosomal protein S16 [Candidatus Dependentiae bacterium HGW-Dependentiae-1]|nr:MAG: 30S ribosomal protein S16 [Candidatus Dependentiae bacterium HGW-Dependentiae-1]